MGDSDWHRIGRYAQRCPSPHNTQPFRLRIRDVASADLVFLPRRGLPIADPLGRFTWLTAGIFAEICAIATHGLGRELRVDWDHSPMYAGGDTETPQILARLHLAPATGPIADLDPKLILDRQASRLPYDGTPVPASVIAELQGEAVRLGHRFETRSDGEAIKWVVELNKQALFHDLDDDALRGELVRWLRFDGREEDLMRDGLSARCMILNGRLLRSFFFQHGFWTLPGVRDVVGAVYGATMKGIGTIGWLRGRYVDSADWVAAGRVMIRLWLMLTRAGLYWHPYGSVITSEAARRNMITYLKLPEESGQEDMVWLLLRLGSRPATADQLPAGYVRNPILRALREALYYPAVTAVLCADIVERVLASGGDLYRLLLVPGFEGLRWRLGIWRAWRSFYQAHAQVPAYRDFIEKHGGMPYIHFDRWITPKLDIIPEMDKASYVKAYPIAQRVKNGRLPLKGVMVDESSGSSGTPTSWVRGATERMIVSRMMQLSYRDSVDRKLPVFILNAFALGAWATGMNVSISLTGSSILKSTGPNIDKIVATMIEFGPDYRYVVMGYPPFLKTLADDPRVDWSKYTVDAGYGGEGISESLRTYLGRRFQRVVGSYGASDLEVNMALESELAIRLRKAVMESEAVRAALIRVDYGVTPMIFQYNPMAYYIETNAAGELVVTMSRPYHIAPKIRYNIHDRGHVLRFPELKSKLRAAGRSDLLDGLVQPNDLPLLFLYGRSDMSIDYYGANVTPDSVREVLYGVDALAPALNTFRLLSFEDDDHTKRMEIAAELVEGATPPADSEAIAKEVFERLAKINGDFYNALYRTAAPDNPPRLTLHAFETGPFAGGQRKLKNEYVATSLKYDAL